MAVGIDSLLVALLRQIRGADLGESNIWLCSEMVNLLWEKWECLVEEQPMIISSALMKDLLSRSSDACQLYRSRTCSRYFLLRITPEMETHLRFLLTQVKLGSQTRYQIWFGRKFLNGPEKETVVIDIVRFTCCAHHPSNDILLSNVIPRWIIVGWLLKCCTKNHIEASEHSTLPLDTSVFYK
ncbi:putative integrator complex subunit 3 [Helianthus annuus]|nr:putative integrator complex subunit 3 [Helianthus annuus]